MTDSTAIALVVLLVVAFFALWIFNGKQKRKFEEAQRQRKRDLAALKAKAAKTTLSKKTGSEKTGSERTGSEKTTSDSQ